MHVFLHSLLDSTKCANKTRQISSHCKLVTHTHRSPRTDYLCGGSATASSHYAPSSNSNSKQAERSAHLNKEQATSHRNIFHPQICRFCNGCECYQLAPLDQTRVWKNRQKVRQQKSDWHQVNYGWI